MKSCLKAGAGTAVIQFPAEMFPVEGFKGVHDAPCARVLMLEDGEKVAIVSLEMVNVSKGQTRLIEIVSEQCGVKPENVWLHITHAITTPHTPTDPDELPPGAKLPPHLADPDGKRKKELFLKALNEATEAAAKQAAATFRTAKLGIGKGQSYVNINRDVETPSGWWVGFNPEGKSNKTVTVLRFEDLNGGVIALMVNYGLKPCAIDNSEMRVRNRLVSSDIPGYACRALEKKYGAPCLYIMSAAGDQVPREMAMFDEVQEDGSVVSVDRGVSKGLEIVARLGEEFTNDVDKVVDGIICWHTEAAIRRASREITCGRKGRIKMKPTRSVEFVKERDVTLQADVMTLGEIAFVATTPEVNAQTEEELQQNSPFKTTLLFSMTNGEMKYMPDKLSFERITWEAQSAFLMEGAAEQWVDAATQALKSI